ncbi:portal protein [Agrobacterium tumefaciens]|uniref:portal protein n=1 Tax=Agrobacterium tumefaciens TaxID=358 RepID=UPI00045962CB|nr:portal protein [Agrobacterium tumefaciens]CDN96081.1 Bacteriophage head to tail connecting protein [Agrobacterium tumefaciens]
MVDSTRERHERRLAALKKERNPYEAQWQELNDLIVPGRYRKGDAKDPKGINGNKKIIDNSPKLAHRVAQSGMQAGLTSPTRPWMRYNITDKDLREFGPVKDYLYEATRRARERLAVSNIYNCLHTGYGDELLFGQFCLILTRSNRRFHGILPPVGQYWLAQSQYGMRVDTCYRRVWMTIEQIVGRWVVKANGRDMDWSKVSTAVKNAWDKGSYDDMVEVFNAIEPRIARDPRKPTKENKPVMSNYWEAGQDRDKMLEISGFDRNPIIAPRWDVVGEDVYAATCPGMDALPDVKMLQTEQRWKGMGIEHQVKPSLVAPTSLKNKRNSSLPGTITFVDEQSVNSAAYRRAFDVNIQLGDLGADIEEVKRRVDRAFYADLFMAISNMEGVQPRNQFELTQRKEEQLQQLGPTVERQHHELIQPLADWVFYQMDDDNDLPEAPEDLQGQELNVENTSTLYQAQLAVSTGSIERMVSFVGNLSGASQDAVDKLDVDQAIDEYGDAIGVVSTIVRSDDKVKEIRAQRAQQMQQQRAAETAATIAPVVRDGAQAAQALAATDENGGPAELLRNLGIAG